VFWLPPVSLGQHLPKKSTRLQKEFAETNVKSFFILQYLHKVVDSAKSFSDSFIQHCNYCSPRFPFIRGCRDGIEPRTVATFALVVRRYYTTQIYMYLNKYSTVHLISRLVYLLGFSPTKKCKRLRTFSLTNYL
jgi:hypothetical protein